MTRSTLSALDAVLATGAALRLSRVVTTDEAGELVRRPAFAWAERQNPTSWKRDLVGGLECPFCVGYWLGLGVLSTRVLADGHPRSVKAWRLIAGSLAMNYVVGHLASRMD